MAALTGLRDEFDATALRTLAKASRDLNLFQRLLSLADIYDHGSRSDVARAGGVVRLAFWDAMCH